MARLTVQPLGNELLYWLNGECIFRHQNDGRNYPINVIKAIREHFPLDLKTAKEIWDARVTDSVAPKERLVRDAAPDLYRELRHLVSLLEPLEQNGSLNVPGLATLNGARKAIARAEGR